MSTSVKYLHSGMAGAPILNGVAGAMVALLDACLVDGFDTKPMTTGAITGGVATLNFSGTHSAEVGTVILVTGAAPASINGQKRVTAKTATSVSFATTESNGAITGTVTFQMAPAGWTKAFTAANKRAYKPSEPSATGCFLRADDAGTTTCRMVGYEVMSDVDTGTGLFPTTAQVAGGFFWPKSNSADTISRVWVMWSDAQAFYLLVAPSSNNNGILFGFGDIISYKSGDAYCCFLSGEASASTLTSGSTLSGDLSVGGSSTQNIYLARASTGLGGSQIALKTGPLNTASTSYSGLSTYSSFALSYPNVPDNGLHVGPVQIISANALRGTLPGLMHTPQAFLNAFATLDKIAGTGAYAGKTLMAARCGSPNSGSSPGTAFVDATGPWR